MSYHRTQYTKLHRMTQVLACRHQLKQLWIFQHAIFHWGLTPPYPDGYVFNNPDTRLRNIAVGHHVCFLAQCHAVYSRTESDAFEIFSQYLAYYPG